MTETAGTEIVRALRTLRAPLQQGEYDLHRLVMDALDGAGIEYSHEAPIAPGCRADLLCGGVLIEIKRGFVQRGRLIRQLERYAASPGVSEMILISERTVRLPGTVGGKPVRCVCLNRLWGIAL